MTEESGPSPKQQPKSPVDDAITQQIIPPTGHDPKRVVRPTPLGDQPPLSIQKERGIPKLHRPRRQKQEPPQEDTSTQDTPYDIGEKAQPSSIKDPIPLSIQKRPVLTKPEYRSWGVRLGQLFRRILRREQ